MKEKLAINAIDVAKYYLAKDPKRELFNNNIVENNGRKSYEGNIRLNKYLFLSQVVYMAKYGKKLFKDDFVAYVNGPIIQSIVNNYGQIVAGNYDVKINEKDADFLNKIYDVLKDASCEELIEISHEDPEWIRLKYDTYNAPILKLENNIEVYKKRYKGFIEAVKLCETVR